MYSRSGGDERRIEERMPLKRHSADMIPPNYGGSAFRRADRGDADGTGRGEDREPRTPVPENGPPPCPCDDRGSCGRPDCGIPEGGRPPSRPHRPDPPFPGGLRGAALLLRGLLVLLLAGGADDDIVIMIAFLLVSTLKDRG